MAIPSKDEMGKRLSKDDIEFFIEKYVYIEDKDNAGIPVPFELWDVDCKPYLNQREALHSILDNRLNIALKARQLGFTWLALAIITHGIIFNHGYTGVALSKTEDPDSFELTRRVDFILRHLPKSWDIKWTYKDSAIEIVHGDKENSIFQSFSAGPNSGRSFTANILFLDEWAFQQWARKIWSAGYPTINRPTGGKVIGISTIELGTLFCEIWIDAVKGINGFNPIFVPWKADPRRDKGWYEATKKALPNTYRAEYPSTPEEAFTVGEGAFFEEWDESIHVPIKHWEPPNDSKRWAIVGAYDPGFSSNACFKWYAISPDGWARCFREYYPHRIIDRDQAIEIIKMSVYPDGIELDKEFKITTINGKEIIKVHLYGTPYKFDDIVADTDAWTPSREGGRSTAETFAEFSLSMRQANKDLHNGWMRLHEWLLPFGGADGVKTALLTFTNDCKNTTRTYPACVSSQTNPEDIDKKCESHPQDVDRYFVMSRPTSKKHEETDYDRIVAKFGEDSPEAMIYRVKFGTGKARKVDVTSVM
jgi:hypothetical protein